MVHSNNGLTTSTFYKRVYLSKEFEDYFLLNWKSL